MGALIPAVLAIDGGNSKTDVALVDSSGNVLAHVRGPGSSPHALGLEGSVDLIEGLVAKAAAQAGYEGVVGIADQASVYLAGADLTAETEELAEAVVARGWARGIVVDNDTFALLRAGTDDRDAVAVVCGAGINCVGVTRDGRQARFPSLGRISGDWGGGVQLGDEALWWAARAVDGRGEQTTLVQAILERFGAPSLSEVIEALHYGRLQRAELGKLAPVVLREASEEGDAIATHIVHRQAQEIAVLAVAALRRLDLLAKPATVVLGGGVLTSGNELLHAEIRSSLRDAAPLANPHITQSAPIVGAALLGLDRLGADQETEARLRASLGDVISEVGLGGSVESQIH